MFKRFLKIDVGKDHSAFLWGPRKTGKSFLLKHEFPKSTSYDFLQSDVLFKMVKAPSLLRQELLALEASGELIQPIILD